MFEIELCNNKIANYVGYWITPHNLQGDAVRESNFYSDTSIPFKYRAYTSNYTNSGYDRGHLSPAADRRSEKNAMHESFCMSNICPQVPNLNRFYWVKIEEMERYFVYNCDTLYVITGTICESNTYIKNKIRVPDYCYKTCIGIHNHEIIISIAWLYKNIKDKQTPENCECTISDIEQIINKDLYSGFWFNNKKEKQIIKF